MANLKDLISDGFLLFDLYQSKHRFYIEQQQQQHNKIPRPKDYRKRKAYCSVNKKRYAEKTQIMTTSNNDLIIHKLKYNK
jgi:hypothetical protein